MAATQSPEEEASAWRLLKSLWPWLQAESTVVSTCPDRGVGTEGKPRATGSPQHPGPHPTQQQAHGGRRLDACAWSLWAARSRLPCPTHSCLGHVSTGQAAPTASLPLPWGVGEMFTPSMWKEEPPAPRGAFAANSTSLTLQRPWCDSPKMAQHPHAPAFISGAVGGATALL